MQEFLGLPLDASAHGPEIDNMIGVIHWLMFALFIGWGIFFVYTLVRFRHSRQAAADTVGVKGHTSSYLEVAVALFEVVLIVGFAVPLWAKRVNAFPDEKEALIVRVVAEQFAWNIHYPGADGQFGRTDIHLVTSDSPVVLDRSEAYGKDDIVTINQLNLPVGKPVIIQLSSKDVIHSLGIPLLRVKQDAIPGQMIPVWFKPVETTDEIRKKLTRTYSLQGGHDPRLSTFVAMDDYVGKDSTVIAPKGSILFEEVLSQLVEAGYTEITAGPDTPMEIACSQLCGLGHYRMRGYVFILTPEKYEEWLKEEASYLAP